MKAVLLNCYFGKACQDREEYYEIGPLQRSQSIGKWDLKVACCWLSQVLISFQDPKTVDDSNDNYTFICVTETLTVSIIRN